ncbi:MAG TPA: riboflavin biosynthesis protein RibF, partial [Cryomorphaceae bacterium]|nr:riboflavin biosynthesis protein RibF [Cryomorphaceae bacterium]
SALDIEHTNVSSTKVRQALNQGNVTLANDYLGYPYSLSGTVIYGDQIGRTLGFPTANIRLDFKNKLI